MQNNLIIEMVKFSSSLNQCKSYSSLIELLAQYRKYNHPFFFQAAGQWCLVYNKDEQALPLFTEAVIMGLNFPNVFWNTISADSIGSSVAQLFVQYESKCFKKEKIVLFKLGYCYLTSCIELPNYNAYESLLRRAEMFVGSHDCIVNEILPMGILSQVFALSDFLRAANGHIKAGLVEQAQHSILQARKLHSWLDDITVNGKDADEYSIEEIAEIGIQRHKFLFNSWREDLLNNRIMLNKQQVIDICSSLSPKNR